MAVKSLKWSQVNAWRLSQHCLSRRLERQDAVDAAVRTVGIQAQVMSAAGLALWARVDGLSPQDVQAALWQERTLVKTWAMRGTLHLLSSGDYALYVAARSLHDSRNWIRYFNYYGVPPDLYQAYLDAAPQILSSEPVTREQFAAALLEHTGSPELHSLVLSKGWGTPLKPLAWRGDLCFGPNQGRSVTFVHPASWTGSWQALDPHQSLQELARRYLRAYGPATPEGFARWWDGGSGITAARNLFKSIETELEAVDVEGWQAFALRTDLETMRHSKVTGLVNMLPLFDAYVLGLGRGQELEPLLPAAYQKLVYRPQGWISAVVLVNGYIQGVWEYKTRHSHTAVTISMFSSPAASVRKGIETEAERLGKFLNTEVTLEYGEIPGTG